MQWSHTSDTLLGSVLLADAVTFGTCKAILEAMIMVNNASTDGRLVLEWTVMRARVTLPRFADDYEVYYEIPTHCPSETSNLWAMFGMNWIAENDWLKMGGRVTKTDGYWLIERMTMTINVEERQEMGQKARITAPSIIVRGLRTTAHWNQHLYSRKFLEEICQETVPEGGVAGTQAEGYEGYISWIWRTAPHLPSRRRVTGGLRMASPSRQWDSDAKEDFRRTGETDENEGSSVSERLRRRFTKSGSNFPRTINRKETQGNARVSTRQCPSHGHQSPRTDTQACAYFGWRDFRQKSQWRWWSASRFWHWWVRFSAKRSFSNLCIRYQRKTVHFYRQWNHHHYS